MSVVRRLDFEEMQFSLFFLAKLEQNDNLPEDPGERTVWTFSQKGLLELTHNWGTETQEGRIYHDGNAEPQGFGHICFSVPNIEAAEAWFDANDVEFVKRSDQGLGRGRGHPRRPPTPPGIRFRTTAVHDERVSHLTVSSTEIIPC